ncbi:myb/SANT-like DNA-binding domain-containing protein 3 [Anabrus simplex]|uniref:myb/SANT-like DNA-binding domain-containing protein 3 n=1 Tax=Anabrus simplex TaxID=316456 RepID=UPI0034DCF247
MAFRMDRDSQRRSSSPGSELDGKKRMRCSNFSSQEKNILIHIIEKYQDIIECKKTDKVSVLERERVWEGIAQEFNEVLLTEPVRTARQLKMCYENLKRRIRKEVSTDDRKPAKPVIDPIAALRNQVLVPSDVDSNSSSNLPRQSSSPQGGSSSAVQRCKPESFSEQVSTYEDSPEPQEHQQQQQQHQPRRKSGNLAKLRRHLLTKELYLINMDIEMKAKKYELEMKVEQAKLEYYRKKTALLDNRANGQL